MNPWFPWLQLAWAFVVVLVIAERAFALFFRLPISTQALSFVRECVRTGDREALATWAGERPNALVAELVTQVLQQRLDTDLTWAELGQRAGARLIWLRTAATLSSTLGLFGGVLAIARGLGGGGGLLALERGLAERLAMREALLCMALGVGTAALCFYALSRLRPAARELVTQLRNVSHLLAELERPQGGKDPR